MERLYPLILICFQPGSEISFYLAKRQHFSGVNFIQTLWSLADCQKTETDGKLCSDILSHGCVCLFRTFHFRVWKQGSQQQNWRST